jgi:transposase
MERYLRLTDGEWAVIRRVLPPQRPGPRRKNDRETVTALLFAQAAGVSLDSLPVGFLNPHSLRNTMQRWRARGELEAVMRAGEPAMQRMRRQYQQHLADLSMRRQRVDPETIGKRPSIRSRH